MQFSNEAEAYVAIASLVVSADRVGTTEEHEFLYDCICGRGPCEELDRSQFHTLLVNINDRLFESDDQFNRIMTSEGIDAFCEAVRAVVPESKFKPAFQMACELAFVDGLKPVEEQLLNRLGEGFGMSQDSISNTLRGFEAKHRNES